MFNGLHGAQQNIDDATQSFSGKQKYEAAWETNPYVHLDLLSQSDSSGTMDRAQFSRAFGVPLPDAVTAEGAAPQLQRNLDESRHPGTAPASGMVAQLDNSRRTITVERDGKPYRTITLSTSTPAMAWSPTQEWLLVADGPDVVAHDVNYGNDTLRLRGGKGNLTALAVDDDGVSGLTVGGEIIHWPTPFGSRVASNHSVFSDAVAIPDTDQALVLTDSGTLVTMSLPDSSVARTQKLPGAGPALSTTNFALSADGNNAVVPSVDITSGEATAILVSLTDSATRTFGLPGCVPFDSAWASPEIVYVACGNAGAGLLNITNGGFTLTPLPYSLRATSVTGTDSRLYVGTNIGLVLHMDPASMSLVSDSGTGCPQDMESLIVSHDGNYVYHGGDAAGNAGCGARGNFTNPAEPRWDRLVYPWQTIDRAAATALSDDGKFVAFGFADGTIRVFTTDTGEPIVIVRPATGSVRGLAFNSSGSQILAVTNDGTALQIGVDVKAADLTHQRQRANELLARAGELGLYG
ncbi:WD40 repeat domain-containing protein [Gordonia aquimaris]|uniref:WD40 repeat domain-containing protein n=1 Tax=Gordonia aquimaris TaxID=2984863 RepID=A0A9X3I6T7_9ACTN|nr:WD40 repeat domain-containing protein [Gordonia aquimaris]MCX2967197.1 WD40 repeat domain-containing protein [Gordonia aquimaris]